MVITMMGVNDEEWCFSWSNSDGYGSWIKASRVYRLLGLLKLHKEAKIREAGLYKSKKREKDKILEQQNLEKRAFNELNDKKKIQMFEEAKRTDTNNEDAYAALKKIYREQKQYDKKEGILKDALRINPEKNEWAYIEMGKLYRDLEQEYGKAEEMFKKAIRINPKNVEAKIELQIIYREQNQYDKAEKIMKQAIRINPKDETPHIEFGTIYKNQKQYDKAEEMFKKAIGINPGNICGYVDLGQLYIELKQYVKAEKILKEALVNVPEGAVGKEGAYIIFGQVYREQERFDKAEEMFKEAIRINPESEYANSILLETYQLKKFGNR